MVNRKLILALAWVGFSYQATAQQILPQDVPGDKAYIEVCRAYENENGNRIRLLKDFLKEYPHTRHRNRIETLIASCHFEEGNYQEAIALYSKCNLENLPNDERDENILKLGTSYLKTGNVKEAAVWFKLLQQITTKYLPDAQYNLAYIDYVDKQYDSALQTFELLKDNPVYAELVPYYMGDIYLSKKDYQQAEKVASDYLTRYAGHKDEAEMKRICGEACYGLGEYMKAVSMLEDYEASATTPHRKALYDLGMSYYQIGTYSKSAETLGKVTTVSDAMTQNAYLHMGLAYMLLKERNLARMSFEQASIADYDKAIKEQALYNYALCIHETSYSPFAESVTVFERFLNEFPNSNYTEKVNNYLVEVYMNTRSYEAALNSISKIQRPGNRILEAKQKILFRLGTQAYANAEFGQAIQYFNRSIETGNYNKETRADAYFWRAEAKYRQENYRSAEEDLRQYLNIATNRNSQEYSLALYNLGYIHFKLKEYNDALRRFNAYLGTSAPKENIMLADAYNRIGDCNFYARHFDEAKSYYTKAVETNPSLGDYSLYQEGFVKGLQRDYTGKIQSLNKLISQYPNSSYLDEALYEQGRAFVQMEDNTNAIGRFQMLVNNFPESNMASRAANEIGLLYYQDDKYDEAISAYKHVIQRYSGSEEARMAQRDLRSIYIDLNRIDDYANFVSNIPGGTKIDVNERDSLTYVAAEKVYMKGEMTEARNSLIRYLQTFPSGAFSMDANYYVGLIDYNQKNFNSSISYLDKVLEYPSNKYSEDAMMMRAEMAYQGKDYTKALELYKLLRVRNTTPERKQMADLGMIRSAYMKQDGEEIIQGTTSILSDSKISPELEMEARYYRAKSLHKAGRNQEAMNDWKVLSKDTRNVYGAEAKYLLAQILFDSGKASEAEQEVLEYIEVSTPHTYWLARSFVLLADVYKQMGKNLDARQYLLSLKQNYQADDDIADMIEVRLQSLETENNQ